MGKREDALKAYDLAVLTGNGLEDAAALMAALLRPKTPTVADWRSPLKIGRRAKFNGVFLVGWEDGTETRVSGVIYDKPEQQRAAAFQAADRLRRLRLRHGWEGEPKAPNRWHAPMMGIKRETPEWWAFVKARPLPEPVYLRESAP